MNLVDPLVVLPNHADLCACLRLTKEEMASRKAEQNLVEDVSDIFRDESSSVLSDLSG